MKMWHKIIRFPEINAENELHSVKYWVGSISEQYMNLQAVGSALKATTSKRRMTRTLMLSVVLLLFRMWKREKKHWKLNLLLGS